MLSRSDKERFFSILKKVAMKMDGLSKLDDNYLARIAERLARDGDDVITRRLSDEEGLMTVLEDVLEELNYMVRKYGVAGLDRYERQMDALGEFGLIKGKVAKLKLGQKKDADAVGKQLHAFLEKFKKVADPAIFEQVRFEASEVSGDIMVIQTNGRMGSTRKLTELERSGEMKRWETEQAKRKKKAP